MLATVAAAQDSAPRSRPWEAVRFHPVEQFPDISSAVIARASTLSDSIVVCRDGRTALTVERTSYSCCSVPPRTEVEFFEARLAPAQVAHLKETVELTRIRGGSLGYEQLLDLARVPTWARERTSLCMDPPTWLDQHQEPDGSWSPADFDWNCDTDQVVTGLGKEWFRTAVTGLILTVTAQIGIPTAEGGPRLAESYLLGRQGPDGSFVDSGDVHGVITDAWATIGLCRVLAAARRPGFPAPMKFLRLAPQALEHIARNQNVDGSWGSEAEPSKALAVTVWNLLALEAGKKAGLETDATTFRKGSSWVESAVAAVESEASRGGSTAAVRVHARACRAVARAAAGAKHAQLFEDVTWILDALDSPRYVVPDAEALLFGALAAQRCDEAFRDEWNRRTKTHVLASQSNDGCMAGSWSMPTIWWADGGRLVSTALMMWALELYYRYPGADWVR